MSTITRTEYETARSDSPTPVLLRPTRILLLSFAALTAIATLVLYVFAARTEDYFAWTVLPPLTAAVMGAGYAAGLLMTVLALRSDAWAYVRVVVLTVLVFTVLTLAATLLHLDRFHFGAPGIAGMAAWFWLAVYIAAPPAMVAVLVLQSRAGLQPAQARRPMPAALTWLAGLQSAFLIGLGTLMFVAPARAASIWPWDITPLTARVLAAWLVALAVGLALTVRTGDLAYARLTALPYAVFGALVGIAMIRYAENIDWDSPAAWVAAALTLMVIATGSYGAVAARAKGLAVEDQASSTSSKTST